MSHISDNGSNNIPVIIGITGRSCSGKTTLAENLQNDIGMDVLHIDMDKFFIRASEFNCENQTDTEVNAIDELCDGLTNLKSGRPASFSKFDCTTKKIYPNNRKDYYPKKFIIIEGILVLFEKDVRDLIDIKVFFDTPKEVCMERRLKKRISVEGKIQEKNRWEKIISPQWDCYLEATRKHTDIVVTDLNDGIEQIKAKIATV